MEEGSLTVGKDADWYKPAETILLTGAGFTKNFRGYLASEMWAAILSQPEINRDFDLRKEMLNELDYEEIYDRIMKPDGYRDDQKSSFRTALSNAYQQMHEAICTEDVDPGHLNSAAAACRHLIRRFAGSKDKRTRGFFFTLNQDLFVERFYLNTDPTESIDIAGLPRSSPRWFNGSLGVQLESDDWVMLPDHDWVQKYKAGCWSKGSYCPLAYIKLHGSYGWQFHDGTPGVVIGHAKTDLLKREPLLNWYQLLFEQVLCAGDRRLVVIGYGFNDEHINAVIARAINHHRLKLYPIYPYSPKDFQQELGVNIVSGFANPKPHCKEIWNGLAGYFPIKVTELYDQQSSSRLPARGKQLLRAVGLI